MHIFQMTLQRRRLDGALGRSNDVAGHCCEWGERAGGVEPTAPLSIHSSLTGRACGLGGRRPPIPPVMNYSRGIEFLQANKSGEKVGVDGGVNGRMFTGFGGGKPVGRKVPFQHSPPSWPSARSDRRAAVCKSLPLHVGSISCGGRPASSPLLHHPTQTGGVPLTFAWSRRHSRSDTGGDKYLVQWSEVQAIDTSAKVPLRGLLLTGRLHSPNQVPGSRKISLS